MNNVYTKINGSLSDGSGISTTSFTNQTGNSVLFVISHHAGYPVTLRLEAAEPYHIDADGYGNHKIIDQVWLSCEKSFIKLLKSKIYRQS